MLIFGEYKPSKGLDDYLTLQFSPLSMALKHRWKNNGLSADFVADYVYNFFPEGKLSPEKHQEVKGSVSYIANELLENAMKFSEPSATKNVFLSVFLVESSIFFELVNCCSAKNKEQLVEYLEKLEKSDPLDLYFESIESGVETDTPTSGLGYLTMMNDYEAKCGWKVEASDDEYWTITTSIEFSFDS